MCTQVGASNRNRILTPKTGPPQWRPGAQPQIREERKLPLAPIPVAASPSFVFVSDFRNPAPQHVASAPTSRHSSYRTKTCSYWVQGHCPVTFVARSHCPDLPMQYGDRCTYLHSDPSEFCAARLFFAHIEFCVVT